nr:hypothetical protein [Tanacetum cinerariifolium]
MHVNFLENKPNVAGSGPEWLFDIDSLTNSMNYQPVSAGNRINGIAGSKIHSDVGQKGKEKVSNQEYILLPVLNTSSDVPSSNEEVESSPKEDAGKKSIVEPKCVEGGKIDDLGCVDQQIKNTYDSKNTNINAAGSSFSHPTALDDFSKMPTLEDIRIFDDAYDDRDEGAEGGNNNLEIVILVSPIPSTRIHKDHLKEQILGEMEPKKVTHSLDDESWVEAMQEELFQFKLLNVWTLVDLPHGKRAIGTKWVYRNKRDQRERYCLKRIFRYLKGHPTLGLWYPKDSPLELIAYSDSDYAGASLDRKSITGGCQFLEFHQIVDFLSSCSITFALTLSPTIYASYIEQFWNTTSSKTVNSVKQIHAIVDGKDAVISESIVRSDLLFDDEDGITCLTNDEIFKNLALMGYEPLSTKLTLQKDIGGRPRRQETMGGTFAQTKSERVLEQPNKPPLTEGYTPGSDRGRITRVELMETCTILSNRVTQLETELSNTKAIYNKAFITLTNIVKKLESQLKQKRSRAVIHSSDEKGLKEEDGAKGDSDQEVEELKIYIRIIPEEDIAIETIPLAVKPPMIIEYKIVKEGKINTYRITRAYGSTRSYTSMINLLKNIDREDLATVWKLVKDKYGNTRPEEGFKNLHIFLLVDKVYPFTPATIKMMLERKLQADQWNEMCYRLLKLMMMQLKKQ